MYLQLFIPLALLTHSAWPLFSAYSHTTFAAMEVLLYSHLLIVIISVHAAHSHRISHGMSVYICNLSAHRVQSNLNVKSCDTDKATLSQLLFSVVSRCSRTFLCKWPLQQCQLHAEQLCRGSRCRLLAFGCDENLDTWPFWPVYVRYFWHTENCVD